MKHVAVVIVNWNGKKDTEACLRSLGRVRTSGAVLDPVVVDNGSNDGSVPYLSKKFPRVSFLITHENHGFTGGNNTGMKFSVKRGCDFVWLLNNDTIADARALTILDEFSNPSIGIAGSKIYFASGHEYHKERYDKDERGNVFWYAGGLIDWDNMYASHRGVDEVDHGQYDEAIDTAFVTGCSMAITRKVIEAIGYLDDRYYLYLEDLDYCMRARRAGYRLRYVPSSVIWHVNAGSTGGAGNPLHDYYITRNRLLVGLRYAPMRTKLALIREAVRFAASKNSEKKRAVLDFFWHRLGRQYEPKKH